MQFEYSLKCCGKEISNEDASIIKNTHKVSKSSLIANRRFLKLLSKYVLFDGKTIDFKSNRDLSEFIDICKREVIR